MWMEIRISCVSVPVRVTFLLSLPLGVSVVVAYILFFSSFYSILWPAACGWRWCESVLRVCDVLGSFMSVCVFVHVAREFHARPKKFWRTHDANDINVFNGYVYALHTLRMTFSFAIGSNGLIREYKDTLVRLLPRTSFCGCFMFPFLFHFYCTRFFLLCHAIEILFYFPVFGPWHRTNQLYCSSFTIFRCRCAARQKLTPVCLRPMDVRDE